MPSPAITADWPQVLFGLAAVLFTLSMVGAALVWLAGREEHDDHAST